MIYDVQQGIKQLTDKQAKALRSVRSLAYALDHRDIEVFNRIVSMGHYHETIFVTDGTQTLKVEIQIQSWKQIE